MRLLGRTISGLGAYVSRRFATKASRFSVAVSSGFIIAFVGLATTALDRAGSAEGLADLFGSGFSGQSLFGEAQPQPQQYAAPSGQAAYVERARRRHVAHRPNREIDHEARATSKADKGLKLAKNDDGDDSGKHWFSSGRSMCVRLCDGYAFPVGDYHGEGDRASHEATCHSECPGAETALYVMPPGSDSIGDAVRVGSGRNYSALPDAFHYTTVLDGACTCHPAGGNRIKSLLRDFTLRRGDAVMTQTGFKVFHGGSQFPYKRKDFIALNRSRDIRGPDRETFRAIERASLVLPTTVAQRRTTSAPTASAEPRNGTKALEHQAALKPSDGPSTP